METIYNEHDLTSGKCKSCSEESKEILKGDGRCVDCVEEQKFVEMTLKMEEEDDHDMFFITKNNYFRTND